MPGYGEIADNRLLTSPTSQWSVHHSLWSHPLGLLIQSEMSHQIRSFRYPACQGVVLNLVHRALPRVSKTDNLIRTDDCEVFSPMANIGFSAKAARLSFNNDISGSGFTAAFGICNEKPRKQGERGKSTAGLPLH
jgi:hypothetical protein